MIGTLLPILLVHYIIVFLSNIEINSTFSIESASEDVYEGGGIDGDDR